MALNLSVNYNDFCNPYFFQFTEILSRPLQSQNPFPVPCGRSFGLQMISSVVVVVEVVVVDFVVVGLVVVVVGGSVVVVVGFVVVVEVVVGA